MFKFADNITLITINEKDLRLRSMRCFEECVMKINGSDDMIKNTTGTQTSNSNWKQGKHFKQSRISMGS